MLLSLSTAVALPCAGLDLESCTATNTLQVQVNEPNVVMVDGGGQARFRWKTAYDRVEALKQVALAHNCTVSGVAFSGVHGGRYQGGQFGGSWVDTGSSQGGQIAGDYAGADTSFRGAYTGDDAGEIGSSFSRYDASGRVAANRDGDFLMGHWVRLGGRRGFHYQVFGSCAGDVPSAFNTWFDGGLSDVLGPADEDLDGVSDEDELDVGTDPGDPASTPVVLRVDGAASGAGDGGSWADAYPFLQDALSAASSAADATTPHLVWVAGGIQLPDQGAMVTAGDRGARFEIGSHVHVFGGFAGEEWTIAQRPGQPASVLSGDIDGNDTTSSLVDGTNAGNSRLVVIWTGSEAATLDGFTVTGAHNEDAQAFGGGVLMSANGQDIPASARLQQVELRGNTSSDLGGGALTLFGTGGGEMRATLRDVLIDGNGGVAALAVQATGGIASPTINGLIVQQSQAGTVGASIGGFFGEVSPTLTQVVFRDNPGGGLGCGSFGGSTTVTLVDGTFTDNAAGGVSNLGHEDGHSVLTLRNASFVGNAGERGGAISNMAESGGTAELEITEATVRDNHGGRGGGVSNLANTGVARLTLRDVQISGNTASAAGGGLLNNAGLGDSVAETHMTNVEVTHNRAAVGGGVAQVSFGAHISGGVTAVNSTIAFNVAEDEVGHVIPEIPPGGGGLYVAGPLPLFLQNTVVWGNEAVDGAGLFLLLPAGPPTIANSLVEDLNPTGPGNLDGTLPGNEPDFVNPLAGDFSLLFDSPLIDAGDDAWVPVGVTTDLAGADRFIDVVDIGAYEVQ